MSFCPFRFLFRKKKNNQKKPKYLPLLRPFALSASCSGKRKVSKRNPSICRFLPPFAISASCDPDIRTLAKLADGIGCTFDCLVGRDR